MTSHSTATRIAATSVAVLVAVIICIYYYGHDPSAGDAPRCMFRIFTGYDCPGCGSQRAIHSLLHGHPLQAWHYNPFIFFAVPIGAFYLFIETWRDRFPRLYTTANRPTILILIAVSVVLWWILRNL